MRMVKLTDPSGKDVFIAPNNVAAVSSAGFDSPVEPVLECSQITMSSGALICVRGAVESVMEELTLP